MIENKKELFENGILVFGLHMCQRDQNAYISGMVHENGYIKAAKKFYEKSGYLTAKDRDLLYNEGTIPEWMAEIFKDVEQKLFGQTIWDKQ